MKLSNKTYDVLKWICLVVIPALNVLIAVIARAWALPIPVEPIVVTLSAVAEFCGAVIGFSTAQYNKET